MPGYATVDLRASRRFPIGGRVNIEAVVDVFNLFNRTNYTEINNIFGRGAYPDNPVPTFGQLERAAPPRQVQLGARVNW
jgi:outer membrane receptor protein involved in Fe transport